MCIGDVDEVILLGADPERATRPLRRIPIFGRVKTIYPDLNHISLQIVLEMFTSNVMAVESHRDLANAFKTFLGSLTIKLLQP